MSRPRSLILGRDPEVLETLLQLHAKPSPLILDTTYGKGTMWKGIGQKWQPVRMDLNPEKGLDIVGDFLDLGHLDTGNAAPVTWDVVVWDPPHVTDAGKRSQLNGSDDRYGLSGLHGHDISCLYGPFLHGASAILSEGGIILAKISDQVHAQRHQWQMVDFINAVRATPDLTACDLVVKGDPAAGKMMGLWKRILHVRNSHCYWIVVRKGTKCFRTDH